MRSRKVTRRKDRWKILITPIIIVAALLWFSYFMINTPSADERYENMEYYSVVVEPGDTLWSIAKANVSEGRPKDIREIIYDIQKVNNLGNDFIQSGRLLKVPIYR